MNNLNTLPNTNTINQVKPDRMTFPRMCEDTSLEIKKDLLNPIKTKDFICTSLFKLFINNNVSLNNLYMTSQCSGYDIILDNPKFISDIKTLNFTFTNILTSLPSLSLLSSIKHLVIYHNFGRIQYIANLIQSQTQLLSLSLNYMIGNTYLLDSFKHCSSTLTSITFLFCDFTKNSSFDGLKYLTRLKSLQIIYCRGLTILSQSFPTSLKVKSLNVRANDQSSGMVLLLQKIGSYLKHLELILWEREKAFEGIINYCNKIKFLYLRIGYENVPQLYRLINNNKHLKYLSLEANKLKISSMILKDLGQVLPNSLKYLNLDLHIDPNDLKIFLENCKHVVGLNHLLVRNGNIENIDVTFNVLKEFVREKRVKDFAYDVNRHFNPNDLDHLNLDKLVNEAQPFVEMKRYDDLVAVVKLEMKRYNGIVDDDEFDILF